ncbi:hypothetical protein B0H10DRAFT_1368655 [Mycena sp. CBHHK59/15]|nr:hypothetical protein B0H10DRAFT_1368655 [Mycena sp. CBHHK59/15]
MTRRNAEAIPNLNCVLDSSNSAINTVSPQKSRLNNCEDMMKGTEAQEKWPSQYKSLVRLISFATRTGTIEASRNFNDTAVRLEMSGSSPRVQFHLLSCRQRSEVEHRSSGSKVGGPALRLSVGVDRNPRCGDFHHKLGRYNIEIVKIIMLRSAQYVRM